jgi:hypothetical protein
MTDPTLGYANGHADGLAEISVRGSSPEYLAGYDSGRIEAMKTMERCSAHGKQVMLDGVHFADAISNEAAVVIACALNHAGTDILDPWASDKLQSYLA